MTAKNLRSIALGGLCSAALLVLALRNVDLRALGETLKQAKPGWIFLLALTALVNLAIRGERWRLLLPEAKGGRWAFFRLTTIGLAVNNVLPLRMGEVARAILATEEFKLPLLTVLASMLIERLLDALSILTLFNLSALLYPDSPWVQYMRPLLLPATLGLAAVFLCSFLLGPLLRNARFSGAMQGHPKLRRLLDQLVLGLHPLRSPLSLLRILAYSLGLWSFDGFSYWIAGQAVPLEAPLPYSYSFIVEATAAMSTVLPTAPGYIGAFEYAVSRAVIPLGISDASAFGYAFVLHMVGYLVMTLLGIYFLYREGNTLSGLWKKLKNE